MMETDNIAKIYKEIFETYLNFCPHYRRNLIDLNDMYKWLEDIDLRSSFFSNKYDCTFTIFIIHSDCFF